MPLLWLQEHKTDLPAHIRMRMPQRLRGVLKKSDLLVRCCRKANDGFRGFLYRVSPEWLARVRYRGTYGRWPDLDNPQSFDEKLLWLMLYWRHPLKSRCADKYGLRSYVAEHNLAHLLPDLLGVYERPEQIDFDAFPDQFALKCTHGWGYNIICRDKDMFDRDEARRRLNTWLRIDVRKLSGEVHYATAQPRIIAEGFLSDGTGNLPSDYKIYCFDGKAHCTMACTDRASGQPKFDFYNRSWKMKLAYSRSSLLADRSIPKPTGYDEMLVASETLAKPFPFVRMDFYDIEGRAVLGEMTFTPHACIDSGYTDLAQRELGSLLELPAKLLL